MSTHEVKVIRVEEVKKHPNADALEIIPVWGYQAVVRKGQFQVGDLAAFIEPDNTVKLSRPEFQHLDKGKGRERHRLTVVRLRGEPSYGLLIKAPEGAVEGDDVMEQLEVEHYDPPTFFSGTKAGIATQGPEYVEAPVYKLENFRKYHRLFNPEDEVNVSVKIHGTNARFVFDGEKMHAGSHKTWKRNPSGVEPRQITYTNKEGEEVTKVIGPESCLWWEAIRQNPWIEDWCRAHPKAVLYGEIYGPNVQGGQFSYGKRNGEYGFAAFDVMENGRWVSNGEMLDNPVYSEGMKEVVPVLFRGKLSEVNLSELAEAKETLFPGQIVREGVVVKLNRAERFDSKHGRVALKYVSDVYLSMK